MPCANVWPSFLLNSNAVSKGSFCRSGWHSLGRVTSACVLLLLYTVGSTQPTVTSEYQLKAAFLFNFLQFVDWPTNAFDSPDQSIALCILGPDPFGAELDSVIAGERINGRSIEIRRLTEVVPAANCHLLYVNVRSRQGLRRALEQLRGLPVLTVSDATAFSGEGGMIEFVRQEDRIRLRVNLRAASEARLRLSSKLLRRSEIVEPAPA
jgi:hypothetical protein